MAEQKLEEIKKIRLEKIKKLIGLGINPYPSKPKGEPMDIASARDKTDSEVSVCGRIMSIRGHGNVSFFDLKDETGKIQLWFQNDSLHEMYSILELLDVGDILYAKGYVTKTKSGEVSINVNDFQLLSKSIRPLPSTWFGVKDVEERFRKRYLDLIFNDEVRKRFNTRTKIIRELRNYLDGLGYWEVETPTLQPLYGGANAKPFKTHHNSLDHDFYLRIADELYLKRLIVGGYKKVYEICKDFRNEGIDQTHSPEFTMIEYYESYADYQRVMDVTEGLFKHLAESVLGEMKMKVGEKEIDIGQKWPRVTMTEIIKEKLKLDVENENTDKLVAYCKENKIELLGGETKGQLIYTIFEHKVTDLLDGPIWIIDYPKDVSPLSKDHPEKNGWVERFEGYIGGKEICDGWSELTNPVEQRNRFESDVKMARKDKEEAQQVDEDFLEAMEYGMPPLGGIGIGIDRLTMFFTNTWFIKETILFPTLKPEFKKGKFIQSGKVIHYENELPDEDEYRFYAIVRKDVNLGKAMNAIGHASVGLAGGSGLSDEMCFLRYQDKNGSIHPNISHYNYVVLQAENSEDIKKIRDEVVKRNIAYTDFTSSMTIGKSIDQMKLTETTKTDDLDYYSIVIFGKTKEIREFTSDFPLFK